MSDLKENDGNQETDESLRTFPAEKPSNAIINDRSFFLKDWKASLLLFAAIGALLWGLIASFGHGFNLWHYSTAITGLGYSFFLSLAVIVFAIIFIIWDRVKNNKPLWILRISALFLALIYAGYILRMIIISQILPAIHDISTDLADPPAFQTLSLRTDNLDNIPNDDDMEGLSPLQRWTRLHQEAYPTIRSVRIDMKVADVITKAERLAKDRGWDIASSVPEQGRLEATETTSIFRFKDDVVLRVKPTQNGQGSVIDMRSVSRVGQSDLGANAQRVESFLADLSGTTTAD